MQNFTDPNGEPIRAIEYQNGIPHAVWTTKTGYDFNQCDGGSVLAYQNTQGPGVYYNAYSTVRPITNQIWIAGRDPIHRACGKRRVKMPNAKSRKQYHSQWRPTKATTGAKARKRLARSGLRLLACPLQLNKSGEINPFNLGVEEDSQWCAHCNDTHIVGTDYDRENDVDIEVCDNCRNPFEE